MTNLIDRTGHKFGKLTVISRAETRHGLIRWNCICECGNTSTTYGTHLVGGGSKSCGCGRNGHPTHGMTGTTEYRSWQRMKERCLIPTNKSFKDYGGRGITICDRWINSFEAFFSDMGKKPAGYSIERINNELGYNPDNCKWATRAEQNANTRRNIYITHNGETMMIRDWSRRLGGDDWLVGRRLKSGWGEIRAITEPVRKRNNGVK